MSNEQARTLLKRLEALRLKPYRDPEGVLTIGWGINLDDGITREEAEFLLESRLSRAEKDLRSIFPGYEGWHESVQAAMLSMMFNLGRSRFLGFHQMVAAIHVGDWGKAVAEMWDSVRAKKLTGRVATETELILENT